MENKINNLPITIEKINSTNKSLEKFNFVSILFNLKDVTQISVNGISYTMDSNDIIVLNSNDEFQYYGLSSSIFWIKIHKSLLNIPDNLLINFYECNSCTYNNKEKFYNLYNLIATLLKASNELTFAYAASLAYNFLDELSKNFKSSSLLSGKAFKISEITSYIEKHYAENIMLKELADEFNLTVPYLSKFFKDNTNKNFADFYDEIRIKHSLFDLLETDLPIIDIAMKHGFANNQAYIRAYKKINGELPSETRKKHKYSIPESSIEKSTDYERIVQEIDGFSTEAR